MKKIKAGALLGGVLKRAATPRHQRRAAWLQRNRKAVHRSAEDAQLKLYGDILPGGFLHYGYFDDPDTQARDISLNDIARAQERYAEVLLGLVADIKSPVLDVGCGMGGLVRMMLARGMSPTALSPDKNQIAAIKSQFPTVPTAHCRFEDVPPGEHVRRYGTIITAESLNYLELDIALPLLDRFLAPGGRWIACDFFQKGAGKYKSGRWESFEAAIEKSPFEIVSRRDITPHVLPTMRYVHLWGHGIARPILEFSPGKIERKQPGVHYLLEDAIASVNQVVDYHLNAVDPKAFASDKMYMLLAMERKS